MGSQVMRDVRGREGFALGIVVLALLVLAGIASAAVAAATGQLRAAAASGQLLAARTAARAGLEATFAATTGTTTASVGAAGVELASGVFGDGGTWRVLDLRITAEYHLLVGEATTGGGTSFREFRPAWWMDPETQVAGHRAVVEGIQTEIAAAAQVLTDRLLGVRPGVEACGQRLIMAAVFGAVLPATGPLPGLGEWAAGVGIGLLRGAMLRRAADSRLPLGAECPECWKGLVTGAGSVNVTGIGRGVLAVQGNVVFAPGSSWAGLVIASGDILVEGSATITGLVRSGGLVELADGAVVDGSACAALLGLESARSHIRPIPVSGSSWAAAFVSPGA